MGSRREDGRAPTTYRAYLLRVWVAAEGERLRASLRDVESGETHAFADLDELAEWLHADRVGSVRCEP
jgi:hypothetical protein